MALVIYLNDEVGKIETFSSLLYCFTDFNVLSDSAIWVELMGVKAHRRSNCP